MGTCALDSMKDIRSLVGFTQASDEPVVFLDGEDECLVAMRPAVFERILFDTDLLNCIDRDELHF